MRHPALPSIHLLVDEDKSGAGRIEYSRMLNSADESSRQVAQSHYLVGEPRYRRW